MHGTTTTLAGATPVGPLAILAVTVVVLLVVGAIFWSFLRRGSREGVSPLAVDSLDAPHLPEPPDPTVLAAEADSTEPHAPEAHAPEAHAPEADAPEAER